MRAWSLSIKHCLCRGLWRETQSVLIPQSVNLAFDIILISGADGSDYKKVLKEGKSAWCNPRNQFLDKANHLEIRLTTTPKPGET